MDRKGYNWLLSVAVVALTLAILAGGQFAWQKFAVAQPMDKLLTSIDGVTKATWEEGKKDDIVQIYVTLANVKNLAKTYGAISDGAKRILGARPYRITISDTRTPELEQFYYQIHYHIQEAIFTGNFSLMAEKVQKLSAEAGITAQIYVEAKAVYIQLAKGEAQMFMVVTR